ncbi:MAG TPA: histidinol dehydrogenase [Ruania sp.]|nr:histidinol dehydrogenase [Ruania sp.]
MMRVIDLRGKSYSEAQLRAQFPRAEVDISLALQRVEPILAAVGSRGAEALADYAEQFDGVRPPSLRVPREALDSALAGLDVQVRTALEEAIRRARRAHEAQLPQPRTTSFSDGAHVHQRWVPVRRVGLYVPGGLAVLPSSVVMNVVAAQVAGVGGLAVASPPQSGRGGLPDETVLAACALLGVDEVYAAGGAQAIAMFAYGVPAAGAPASNSDPANSCPPVDVITGPGNIYVAAAKRAVRGLVGIDSEAGTTEIAVLADETADPAWVAADLISQAEHDPAAASVLITDSEDLAGRVAAAIEEQAAQAKQAERIRTALSGQQSYTVLVDDLDQGVDAVNAYAAEHLEIQTADAAAVAQRVHNAGAIFLGPYSPVPLGDYIAGSNHVLPTGGTARFTSGLGVHAFLKSVQVIDYDAESLDAVTDQLSVLAEVEGLPAHGQAARLRRQDPAQPD